jgi:hypothetical protein
MTVTPTMHVGSACVATLGVGTNRKPMATKAAGKADYGPRLPSHAIRLLFVAR